MKKLHIQNPSRKFWIIAAAIAGAVLITAGLAFWLLHSVEASATASIDKTKTGVGASIETLNNKLANKKITPKDRLAAFNEFNQTLTKLNGDICKEDSKNIMFAISKAHEHCDVAHEKLLAVKVVAEKLEMSIKDDQTLAKALQPIKDVDVASASKQLEIWSTLASNLPSTEISNYSPTVKNQLLAVAIAHKTALQELTDADKAQDKTNYNASVAKLNAAHAELGKIIEAQSSGFKKILAELKQAMAKLEQ